MVRRRLLLVVVLAFISLSLNIATTKNVNSKLPVKAWGPPAIIPVYSSVEILDPAEVSVKVNLEDT